MSSLKDLTEQAHAMLEMHLGYDPQLLAAAKAQMEEQIATSPDGFRRKMDNTPEGKIAQCRNSSHNGVVTKALDNPIKQFLEEMAARNKHNNPDKDFAYPAVDLASGSAYFTSRWALRYCTPSFCKYGSLEWYPTDTEDALEHFTRPCLEYLAKEADVKQPESQEPSFLCRDRNGDGLVPRQRIQLQGLNNVTYNGQEGVLLNRDPKVPGRYAVQLDNNKTKPISFKSENLVRKAPPTALSPQNLKMERDGIYKGMIERSCHVDLLKRETWLDLLVNQNLKGKCALVTCTNLLTEIGHREPTVWTNVMEIGSALLISGGFLLHGDADGWGHFGKAPIMEEHANANSLGLTLHSQVKLDNDEWALVLWRKL